MLWQYYILFVFKIKMYINKNCKREVVLSLWAKAMSQWGGGRGGGHQPNLSSITDIIVLWFISILSDSTGLELTNWREETVHLVLCQKSF